MNRDSDAGRPLRESLPGHALGARSEYAPPSDVRRTAIEQGIARHGVGGRPCERCQGAGRPCGLEAVARELDEPLKVVYRAWRAMQQTNATPDRDKAGRPKGSRTAYRPRHERGRR